MNILLINHYAGSLRHGMEFRPYYLAREWVQAGHQVTIVAASDSHLRLRQPECNGAITPEELDGVHYVWLATPKYSGNGARRAANIFAFVAQLWRFRNRSVAILRRRSLSPLRHIRLMLFLPLGLRDEYGRSPFFKEVWSIIAPIYENAFGSLADFNQRLIVDLAAYLGLNCRIFRSSELNVPGTSDDRLIALIEAVGGTQYLSGKGGQNYQDPKKFCSRGIDLNVRTYLPTSYIQIHGDPIFGLSILDAIFNLGKDAIGLLTYETR